MKNIYEVNVKDSQRTFDVEADTYKLEEGYCTFTWMGINVLSIPLRDIGTIRIKSESITDEQKEELSKKFKVDYES